MSTTIQYKGNTLATVSNNTKTLKTAGKYMEGDVVLTDVSGGSEAISVVDTLDTNGGTIRTITAVDISDTTAQASDVAQGKYFYTADGTKTAGTSTGGGGGSVTQDQDGFIVLPSTGGGGGGSTGLVYESGTFSPSEDVVRPTINFNGTHTEPPMFVTMVDTTDEYDDTLNTNYRFTYIDWFRLTGVGYYYASTSEYFSLVNYQHRLSTATSLSAGNVYFTINSDNTTATDSTYSRYWVSNTAFYPYTNTSTTTRYWRTGHTYKWIAVWSPTT